MPRGRRRLATGEPNGVELPAVAQAIFGNVGPAEK